MVEVPYKNETLANIFGYGELLRGLSLNVRKGLSCTVIENLFTDSARQAVCDTESIICSINFNCITSNVKSIANNVHTYSSLYGKKLTRELGPTR